MAAAIAFRSSFFLLREKADRKHDQRYCEKGKRCYTQPGASISVPYGE